MDKPVKGQSYYCSNTSLHKAITHRNAADKRRLFTWNGHTFNRGCIHYTFLFYVPAVPEVPPTETPIVPPMTKLRRRIEDYLRKYATEGQLRDVADMLNINCEV